MSWETNHKEARKTRRFRTNGNVFGAFFNASQGFVNLGQIMDISESGAGVLYLGGSKQTGEASQLGIYSSDERLSVGRLPCKIIYDMELRRDSGSTMTLRRCGVQFGQLFEFELSALRDFIESHKADEGAAPAPA